jgi:nitroreductase
MEVIEAIKARHSVRDFKTDTVSKAVIDKILEAAVYAPSTVNSQPWNIYVAGGAVMERIRSAYLVAMENGIEGKTEIRGTPSNQLPKVMQDRMNEMRKKRMKLMGLDPLNPASQQTVMTSIARLFNAPVMLILTMDKVLDKWSVYDMGLLSQNIMLAAQSAGLGSIVAMSLVGHPDILREELGIPDSQTIIIGIALGYTDTLSGVNSYISSRRPMAETVTYKGF